MNILDTIVTKKRERLTAAKGRSSLNSLRAVIDEMSGTRDFTRSVRRNEGRGLNVIAEIKKASPSKGLIREDFDPEQIARIYDSKNAAAISVLTEEDFFQGSLSYMPLVKKTTRTPVLRKDFIFDEYQIYESRAHEADAILLIAAILGKGQAGEYLSLAGELGLHVLFEVHSRKEMDMVLDIGAPIIGINNRDLKTLDISLHTTIEMLQDIPSDRIVVSESGISERKDVELFENTRVDAVLIGTSLMKRQDIGKAFDELFPQSAGLSV